MAEEVDAAQVLALREAILQGHSDDLAEVLDNSRVTRARVRLRRYHLAWLLAPAAALQFVALLRHGVPVVGQLEETIRIYRRSTGLDPGTARAEVDRIGRQLLALQHPSEWLGQNVDPGLELLGPEIDAAADALIGYYLRRRRTDDALLVEVLDQWALLEDLHEEIQAQAIDHGLGGFRSAKALHSQQPALGLAYLTAWRNWLDHT